MRAIGAWAVAGMAAVVAISAVGIAAANAGRERSVVQTAQYVAEVPDAWVRWRSSTPRAAWA